MTAIDQNDVFRPTRATLMRTTAMAIGLIAQVFGTGGAQAQNLNWDASGADGIQGGDGTWNLVITNWQLVGAAASDPRIAFTNGSDVTFGVSLGTVDIKTTVSPNSITFVVDGYTIKRTGATDTLDVTTSLAINVNGATNDATINAPITMSNGETVIVNGGAGATGTLILDDTADVNPGAATGTSVELQGGSLQTGTGTVINSDYVNTAGTTTNNGDITGALTVTGGQFNNQTDGDITGLTTVNGAGAVVNANGGDFNGDLTLTLGTVNYTGDSIGNVTANGGLLNVNDPGAAGAAGGLGILRGNLVNNGATTTVAGQITGTVDVTAGTVTNTGNGDIDGLTTVNGAGAIVNGNGGDFNGGLTLTLGTVNYNGNSAGDVTANGGALNVNTGGTLSGTLNNAGTTTVIATGGQVTGAVTVSGGSVDNDGTIDDNVTVSGTGVLTNTGSVTGTVALSGGTVNNNLTGDIDGVVTVTGGTLNANGGVFNTVAAFGIINGTAAGQTGIVNINTDTQTDVRNRAGTLNIAATATLDGNIDNNGGTANIDGGVTGTIDISASGTVATTGTAVIDGDVTVAATGTLNAAGGTFNSTAGIINDGGTVNITAATTGNITHNTGTTTIGAALTGNVTQNGGTTVTNNGGIIGAVVVDGGTFDNNSSISLTAGVTGGIFNNNVGGSAGGLTTVSSGGVVNANGGTFNGIQVNATGTANINADTSTNITNNAGTVDIDALMTLTGNVINQAGITTNSGTVLGNTTVSGGTFNNDSVVTGNVSVSGTGTFDNDATVTGDVTVAGTGLFTNDSVLTGNATITGGTFDNNGSVSGTATVSGTGTLRNDALASIAGAVSVGTGGTLVANGGTFGTSPITNNGGTIDVDANTTAGVTNTTGDLNIDAGTTLTGDVTNGGDILLDGTIAGNLVTSGIVDANGAVTGFVINESGGVFTVDAAETASVSNFFDNQSGATLNVGLGSTFTSANLVNRSGATVNTEGTIAGPANNAGTINATDAMFSGDMVNTGLITGAGTLTFGSTVTSSGTISLSQNTIATDVATDVLRINGSANITGTLQFDIDLNPVSPSTVGSSDMLVMGAGAILTGSFGIDFNALEAGGVDVDDLIIINVDEGVANAFNINSVTGLPVPGGKFVYALVQPVPGGDIILQNFLNPGITALAGNITLTQSLIGSVINRPSSPFVSGLAYDDPDSCGPGVWARAVGGRADASGNSTSEAGTPGETTFNSTLSAGFAGAQLGGDFACFNGFVRGWDLAAGGIAGANFGKVDQPVTVPTGLPGAPPITTSNTRADFLQYYGGVYMTASRGPLALDLQYRLERTDFTVTNTAVAGGSPLGITDEKFSSNAQTMSGSASYGFPIGDSNIAVVPTLGFAWTRTKTDSIEFDNGDTLEVADFENRTGFVGATVARTVFSESGDSLFRQFVTATYYNDFAADPTAVFNYDDGLGGGLQVDDLVNENLGSYTELSVGLNYVRILNPGQIGPARQLDASVRADARFGDQLKSWGVTGQVRLQF